MLYAFWGLASDLDKLPDSTNDQIKVYEGGVRWKDSRLLMALHIVLLTLAVLV